MGTVWGVPQKIHFKFAYVLALIWSFGFGPLAFAPTDELDFSTWTEAANKLVMEAQRIASRSGAREVTPSHLLLAVLNHAGDEPNLGSILRNADFNIEGIKFAVNGTQSAAGTAGSAPHFSATAGSVLLQAQKASQNLGKRLVPPEALLIGLIEIDSPAAIALRANGSTGSDLYRLARRLVPAAPGAAAADKPTTPDVLLKFGRNLTELARIPGKLNATHIRLDLISRLDSALDNPFKNRAVLLGDSRVGKSSLVYSIAQMQAAGDPRLPKIFQGKEIIELTLSSLLEGGHMRGAFENNFKSFLEAIKAGNGKYLLYIPGLEGIRGLGATGQDSTDGTSILNGYIEQGALSGGIIGESTYAVWNEKVRNTSLETMFAPVEVPTPDAQTTEAIIKALRPFFEQYYAGVTLTDEGIREAIRLGDRYYAQFANPERAILIVIEMMKKAQQSRASSPRDDRNGASRDDLRTERESTTRLLAEARGLEARYRATAGQELYAEALAPHIAAYEARLAAIARELGDETAPGADGKIAVAERHAQMATETLTGIPVGNMGQNDALRLIHLPDELRKDVVDQDEAVDAVAMGIKLKRVGIGNPNKPANFLFRGPTGRGKTELAKSVAKRWFMDPAAFTRIDMSEFQEKHTVSRLIGAPPGYEGFKEGGRLTEAIRRRPYQVILLDEIEKAHRDVLMLFLQLMDDGRLTDGMGRPVDGRNLIIIMTTNVTNERINAIQNGTFGTEFPGEIPPFAPEFLGRFGGNIISFQDFSDPGIRQIINLSFSGVIDRLKQLYNMDAELSEGAKDFFIAEAKEQISKVGGRAIEPVLNRYVTNHIANGILNAEAGIIPASDDHATPYFARGEKIVVRYEDTGEGKGRLHFDRVNCDDGVASFAQ